jgi:squalene synthase HpnC
VSVDHYENFPVASWLCPPRLRPAVTAIYRFARTADDIADEGNAPAAERVALLHAYRRDLRAVFAGQATSERWPRVFEPIARARGAFDLPWQPLDDLLGAFLQDTGNPLYATRAELLDYCTYSANPIGRLMLHLLGHTDGVSLRESDSICSGLQLANFWQDLSVDLPRGRIYLPLDDLRAHGLAPADLADPTVAHRLAPLVRDLSAWTESLLRRGAPLARRIPGRAGWELRLVVQGGLRILEKIERMRHLTRNARPKLARSDAPLLLWRAAFTPMGAMPG